MKQKIFALGFFDGVHLGHRALLDACVRLAKERDLCPAAITFREHPQKALRDAPPALLSTLEERTRLLQEAGIRQILPLPVTAQVLATPWQDFLEGLMAHGAAGFVCGDDFRFGQGGQGNAERLGEFCRQQGIPFVTVPQQQLDGIRVSSTHIRQLLLRSHAAEAARFLGHPYRLTGTVVHGRQLGRTMGIPTANLAVPRELLIPGNGVYACRASVEGESFPAVTNIGLRPTVGGHHVTVEPWLLDFEGDLYGRELTLELLEFLRPEQKFDSLQALRQEILRNAQSTRAIYSRR